MPLIQSRELFWRAVLILAAGLFLTLLPTYSGILWPSWAEGLLYTGGPTLSCILLLYLPGRQKAYRMPLVLLALIPMATIHVLMQFGPSISSIGRKVAFLPIPLSCVGMLVYYTLRVRLRSHSPRLVWLKWGFACVAALSIVYLMVLLSLSLLEELSLAPKIKGTGKQHFPYVLVFLLSGLGLFVLTHLVDLWQFGTTEKEGPDYEDMIEEIAGEE